MSHAIFDLELEAPPATVIRYKTSDGLRWVVRCELCGRRTTPRPLMSAAMRSQYAHGREHYRDMLARHETRARTVAHRRRPQQPSTGAELLVSNDRNLSRSTPHERRTA